MRTAIVLGALALAGTLASPTLADNDRGFRMGMTISSDKLEGTFNATGFGDADTNVDQLGYGLFGGYTFFKWLAVEAGLNSGSGFNQFIPEFADLVEVPPPVTTPPTPNSPAFFVVRNDFKSFESSAVVSWWISDKFSLYGRGGFIAWRDETTVSVGDLDDNPQKIKVSAHDNGFAPLIGVGVQTKLDGALMRLEYRVSDVGDLNFGGGFEQTDNTVSALSFSIVWQLR